MEEEEGEGKELKEREKMQLRPFKKVHSRLARNKTEFTQRRDGKA